MRSNGRVVGCPLGRLAGSISHDEPEAAARLGEIFEGWIGLLTEIAGRDRKRARSALAEIQGRLLLHGLVGPE